MDTCDALVVGGGPAGSSCARALERAGLDVVVLDRASFPRDKVCAGWVTPELEYPSYFALWRALSARQNSSRTN